MKNNKEVILNENEVVYSNLNFEIDAIYDTAQVGLCIFDKDILSDIMEDTI